MKNVVIKGGQFLKGEINIPPSKSLSHRAIIAAGLAKGKSKINNLIFSVDINATILGMEKMGSVVTKNKSSVSIVGNSGNIKIKDSKFDCYESGSTLRFLIPLAMASGEAVSFDGKGALCIRPLTPYFDIFDAQKINYTYKNALPLEIKGSLKASKYIIPGNISSQFISGLMFLLPLLEEASEIEIIPPYESRDYVKLTMDVLNDFNVKIKEDEYRYFIEGNQHYEGRDYNIEGDYSQLAFWLVAGLLNGDITARGMKLNSSQGDRALLEIIHNMGGRLGLSEDKISVKKQKTKARVIDASQCPDIIPILTVLAAVSSGETTIINASRLRIKECDRLKAIATELNNLGANIKELDEGLVIQGKSSLKGGKVKGWNDHRIVMSLGIASLACESEVFIEGSDAIKKSYPHFWEDFIDLGGKVNEWHLET
jgi:3-phosphoshikimate 1-carboxyvinyltransferase